MALRLLLRLGIGLRWAASLLHLLILVKKFLFEIFILSGVLLDLLVSRALRTSSSVACQNIWSSALKLIHALATIRYPLHLLLLLLHNRELLLRINLLRTTFSTSTWTQLFVLIGLWGECLTAWLDSLLALIMDLIVEVHLVMIQSIVGTVHSTQLINITSITWMT